MSYEGMWKYSGPAKSVIGLLLLYLVYLVFEKIVDFYNLIFKTEFIPDKDHKHDGETIKIL